MTQEFVDQVNKTAQKAVEGMHTALPGKVTAFDPETCLASVQPVAKYKKPNGETMDYPVITGVPVVFPRSGSITVAWPVKAGDGCLLVFAESALDYWQYGKETDTDLKFDLSNAIAIPGLAAEGCPAMRAAAEENAVVVTVGSTALKVTQDGVTISGKLTVEGEITATDVKAKGISLATHTHTGDSGGSTSAPH
jgi:hypothetical protein